MDPVPPLLSMEWTTGSIPIPSSWTDPGDRCAASATACGWPRAMTAAPRTPPASAPRHRMRPPRPPPTPARTTRDT